MATTTSTRVTFHLLSKHARFLSALPLSLAALAALPGETANAEPQTAEMTELEQAAELPNGWTLDDSRGETLTIVSNPPGVTITLSVQKRYDPSACPPVKIAPEWNAFHYKETTTSTVRDVRSCSLTRLGMVKTQLLVDRTAPGAAEEEPRAVAMLHALFEKTRYVPPPPADDAGAPTDVRAPFGDYAILALGNTDTQYEQGTRTVDAFGLTGEVLIFNIGNSPFGMKLGGAGSVGGGRFGYDLHLGGMLGFHGSMGALALAAGIGGDDANLGTGAAFYGFSEALTNIEWAEWFQTYGSIRYLLRTSQTNEAQAQAGIALACFAGKPPCWQLTAAGVWSDYISTQTQGWGAIIGVRFFIGNE
jgi:hypothetical protein